MNLKILSDQVGFSFAFGPPVCLSPFFTMSGDTLHVVCNGLVPLERSHYRPSKIILIAKENTILFALTLPQWMPTTYFDEFVVWWEEHSKFVIDQTTYSQNENGKVVGYNKMSAKGKTADYYLISGAFDTDGKFMGMDIFDIPVTDMRTHYPSGTLK